MKRHSFQRHFSSARTAVCVCLSLIILIVVAGCGARTAAVKSADTKALSSVLTPSAPGPIDPQRCQDQQDMTWDDYHPIPGANWADPSLVPARSLRIALVAVDFPDQPFVITLPKGSDPFGNPQIDPVPRAAVPQFYADFYNKPQALNHGHTVNEYWMEQSRGRVGIPKIDAYGPYRMPKNLFQYGLNEWNQQDGCPGGFKCDGRIEQDADALWIADAGKDTRSKYDIVLRIYAGYDETGVWQEFGEMKFQTRDDIPADWGLKNARLEPWDFGHRGWANERAEGRLISPITATLDFRVAAWTPSTIGSVTASAMQLIPPQGSLHELGAWLKANEHKVHGRIVLLGKAAAMSVPPVDKEKAAIGTPPPRDPNRVIANQREEMINKWLAAGGALVRLYDGGGANGLIHEVHNRTFEAVNAPPGVILRNEDYSRIERLLQDGEDVRLEFNIANHWYPEGRTTYNVLAEIPGIDKPNEVIMLGAHLDSWNLATGATDNAAGVAMMMEAVRVIQVAGLKPARTIRIGLWSAEEEGLLGSQTYVREHLGSFENPKPDFSRVLCYFNIDAGAGSVRSVMVFGPESEQTVLREAIAPFADLGVVGSSAFLSRALGSTDSSSFSHAGVSTIDLMQNSTDYGSTHHTNLDTIEHVTPEELIKGATVIAGAVWHVANRSAPLPLFDKSTMPPPVPER